MSEEELMNYDEGILISDNITSTVGFLRSKKDQIVPYSRLSMIDTRKFLEELSAGVVGFKCPDILPRNCRFFSSSTIDGELSFVLEFPPLSGQ